MRRILKRYTTALILVLAASLLQACGGSSQNNQATATNTASANTSVPASSPTTPQTQFERDLQYVRNGQFTYILIFSRKDGGKFDQDDITYLKANAPKETNQWVSTDEGRRIIAGTNFEFTVENLDALQKRFKIEDYSGR
jgi:hypothetical protein